MEIKTTSAINPAPATSADRIYFVIREARYFGDRTKYAELCPEAVQKYCPKLTPYIVWEAKQFNLPLVVEFSGGKIEWRLSRDMGDMAVYAVHALLTAGFGGNAHYEPCSYDSGREYLVYDGGDEIGEFCKKASPEDVLSAFTLSCRESLARTDVKEAVAKAFRGYFGSDDVPVLKDSQWEKPSWMGYAPSSPIGEVEQVGMLAPETLVEALVQNTHKALFVSERCGERKCTWSIFNPEAGAEVLGVLSRDGALISERREKYGKMYPVGCEARKHIDEEGF